MSVDFPDPDGPMIAVNLPPENPAQIESRARTDVAPSPYVLTPSIIRAAGTPGCTSLCRPTSDRSVLIPRLLR